MPPESPRTAAVDVVVCIVSLNTRTLLAACLQSVFNSTGVSLRVYVVDNASSDGSAEMVAQDFPQVSLIRSSENSGFAAANNQVLRQASGRYVLLLNPDTVTPPSALAGLIAFMDSHPDVGVCGPRIVFADGRFQSCGYSFPTALSEIRQSKNIGRILRHLVGEDRPARAEKASPVDWVDGACFLIRGEAIREVGYLDEQFFLYSEELDWCFRAQKAGWQVYVVPEVEIVHHQGQSSGQMSDFSLAHLVETKLRYYRKHHGVVVAAGISAVYAAGFLKQMTRDRRKARVKLYATARWWRTLLTV